MLWYVGIAHVKIRLAVKEEAFQTNQTKRHGRHKTEIIEH